MLKMSLNHQVIAHKESVTMSQKPISHSHNQQQPLYKPPNELHWHSHLEVLKEVALAEKENSASKKSPTWQQHAFRAKTRASKKQDQSKDTRTHWKAVNIPSSSSSSHGSILSSRTDDGINGWREWDEHPSPTTTKRLRASEKQLLSCSLSPTPPLKKSTSFESH